ncbi:hypothetical protein ACLOJK_017538 [Asimina triloba]
MTKAEEGLPEEGLSLQRGRKPEDGELRLPPQKGGKKEEGVVEVGGIPLRKGENAEEGGLLPQKGEKTEEQGLLPQKGEKTEEQGLLPQKGEKTEEQGLLPQKGEKEEEGLVEEEEGLLAVLKGKGFRNLDLNRGDELKRLAEENNDIRSKATLYYAAGTRYSLAKSWTAAAGTLGKSAECFKEIRYYKEAAKLFMEAGEASLKIFDKDAMYYFYQAVEQLIESNEVLLAAKCCERIGALYKCSRQYDHSLLFYKRWVDLCEATQDTFLITRSKHEVEAVTRRLKGWGPLGDFDIEERCTLAFVLLIILALCLCLLYTLYAL